MKKLIISAPFGNWFNYDFATSTIGTYTRNFRAGPIKRWMRVLLTVRYFWRPQAWINKLGLPNEGIDSISQEPNKERILSILGFNSEEWLYLIQYNNFNMIELNYGCPNISHRASVSETEQAIRWGLDNQKLIIAKLPPVKWMKFGNPLYELGIRHFHLCNTIPSPGGGLSGKPLKQYSLWAIEEFRQRFEDHVTLIGGGGITNANDVRDYYLAGADHVSIASILLNPFNWRKIKELI